MSSAATSLIILACVVAVFIWNRLPVSVVALLTALSLYAFGVLSLDKALAGFGDPIIVFIASLFVVSEGIDASGVSAWAGQALIERGGRGRVRLVVAVLALAAIAAALITPNGAVAALLPMVVMLAIRTGRTPSQMLMPLAFASGAGALLALTGSPVNVIVSEAAASAPGGKGFSFFSFAIVGAPLVISTIALSVWLGPRVLPTRVSAQTPPDLAGYADMLAHHYDIEDGLSRLRVRPGSPLIGVDIADVSMADYPNVSILGCHDRSGHMRTGPVQVDDLLIVSGASREISHMTVDQRLAVATRPFVGDDGVLVSTEMGVAEVVIPPRSPLVGETVYPGMLRGADVVILAIRRLGRDLGPVHTKLADGDSLLVHGAWPAIEELASQRDVLVVDSPDIVRRQVVPLGSAAVRALLILAGMVVLLAIGVVPPAVAALLAAIAMTLSGVITEQQAIRSVSWQTIILIGGLIPLSTALKESGAADDIAKIIVDIVGTGRPYLLLLALFVLTAAVGQVVSNTATALIVAPIAVVAAGNAGVSVRPMLMVIAVAGAASFLTPIATATNMMVTGPGAYRFGDFWRLGLPLMLVWLVIALAVIPLAWPF